MLFIILDWAYVFFTTYCLGIGFSCFCGRVLGYRLRGGVGVLMAGLVVATVYAQIFSLFGGVGMAANVLLLVCCALLILLFHRQMMDFLLEQLRNKRAYTLAAVLVLLLVWAYFTSRGYMMYDSDLYHAQSIRWIEEYGVVKGLGLLHGRFAYNSSFLSLCALYSMKWLCGQSLHAMSGYFAFLLSLTVLPVGKCVRRRGLLWSDYARIAAAYYLTMICDEVVSPATDYPIMCTVFFIVICWLEQLENKEQNRAPYCLLCVAGVYAVTLKLTAGLILILLAKPALILIKEKRGKEIAVYLTSGLLVAAPWIIRTFLISGYLFYPLAALDLFDVDWKMSAAYISVDAAQIKTWGRALYNSALVDLPVTEWFPNWFGTPRSRTENILIIADFASLCLAAAGTVGCSVKKAWKQLDELLVLATVGASYLYWQLSAPLLRYGYAYVLLLVSLTAGWILTRLSWDSLVIACLVIASCYNGFMLADYAWGIRGFSYYITQQEYG
ncbi:MAG: hypothetical protein LUE87_04510, partial [Lachnospiraceae bacterium]|nr:hypothetical protein [Lachnospiraceae bacterium]